MIRCTEKDPGKRINLSEIIWHRCFSNLSENQQQDSFGKKTAEQIQNEIECLDHKIEMNTLKHKMSKAKLEWAHLKGTESDQAINLKKSDQSTKD